MPPPPKLSVRPPHQVCLCVVVANLLTDLVDLLLIQLIAALVLNTLQQGHKQQKNNIVSS
jgi:hypothetical protein